eukprot:1072558-Rhodomonas_salina.1
MTERIGYLEDQLLSIQDHAQALAMESEVAAVRVIGLEQEVSRLKDDSAHDQAVVADRDESILWLEQRLERLHQSEDDSRMAREQELMSQIEVLELECQSLRRWIQHFADSGEMTLQDLGEVQTMAHAASESQAPPFLDSLRQEKAEAGWGGVLDATNAVDEQLVKQKTALARLLDAAEIKNRAIDDALRTA